jgi:hypothetical protein
MPPSEIEPPTVRTARSTQEVPDEDLDRMILTRLALLGVDLSVLPEDDPEAPADQRRILSSARRFLRSTPPALADFEMDPQEVSPVMFPAALGVELGPDR